MYEEHDTDAHTHATDLNGIGASPTRSSGKGGFWDLSFCFITMRKSYVRHHRILIPSTSARRSLGHDVGLERHARRLRPLTSRYRFG